MTLDTQRTDIPEEKGFSLVPVLAALTRARAEWRAAHHRATTASGGRALPAPEAVERIVAGLRGALFPMRLGPSDLRQESEQLYVGHTLDVVLRDLVEQVVLELGGRPNTADPAQRAEIRARAHALVRAFAQYLPTIRIQLDRDVLAAHGADPAARSVDEVLLCYPGLAAMIHHRIAHQLYRLGAPLIARMISEAAHRATGIDIHPGATIGEGFFIDHGTGVVIGETTVIGNGVRLFQAVTLGANSFPADAPGRALRGQPRHPIVEDDVVIHAGATVLGRVTLGRGAVIGGNVWLTESVAPGAYVTQAQLTQGTRPGPATD
ncbi:serine acetyltransferase [Rhodobacter capsulatus]|uniref:serine O-acetyltransferase EpsC n=1 Tax=Rhodobacter capsulatus TaxID=1061 RepID=UPI0006DC7EFD|nr:serine O-acetyltransferase EpsC [Rhodobacter capsulatus]KQB12183.1 serine acetyltransferase [Rhodobacter capsulatus]KQB12675.1 serine acetyltransferase [Rhodobacter capsulatus]PZX23238.1 serine O-acetyltransferase [Rhodobacter capsulatus]QNR61746.1 serine acetyltransferase [Rhodobacter capsulatus]